MSTVFLSYRHEDESHSARVSELADRLQARGIDVAFDVFTERDESGGAPSRGWANWSTQQAASAPSVLVIASSGWFEILQGGPDADDAHTGDRFRPGKGVAIEAATVLERLYRAGMVNRFLAIGYFDQQTDLADCPPVFDVCPQFDLTSDAQFDKLVTWLQRPPATDGGRGPVMPHAVPRQLPPAAEKFFGREKPLRKLVERLRDGRNTAVAGAAGMGKTALAAEALGEIVGPRGERLADSPFPHGVVFLDLYRSHAQAETVWSELADAVAGTHFEPDRPARARAAAARRGRRVLVVIEGAEEADGTHGRPTLVELLDVLDNADNRRLVLTRMLTQAFPNERILLDERLAPDAAAALLDLHSGGLVMGVPVRERVLDLLDGHPLGLTWAAGLLGMGDEDPQRLVEARTDEGLASLADPVDNRHSLEWLFRRSVRGLDDEDQRVLSAAGLLARAPFPLVAMEAIGGTRESLKRLVQRGLLRRHRTTPPPPTPRRWIHDRQLPPTNAPTSPDTNPLAEVTTHPSVEVAADHVSTDTGSVGGVAGGSGPHYEFTHVLGYEFARGKSVAAADLRRGLADWLHGELSDLLTVGRPVDPLPLLPLPLQHAAALLRTDHDQQLWRPLANFVLYDGHDRLVSLGRLDQVRTAVQAVSAWLDQFPESTAAEPTWQRERYSVAQKLGDLAVTEGDLLRAKKHYSDLCEIVARLAESDPDNAAWQRDLSVSLNKLGDLAVSEGNLPEAQRLFGESLAIAKRLAESDPGNAEWQRDLSVSLEKLGNLAVFEGNLPEAQRLFGECHATVKRLAESDPGNAKWQRDLSVSLNKLGNLAVSEGNLPEAQRLFGESRDIFARLAESDPGNAAWQRDLSVSLNNLGELAVSEGNLPEAQRLFGECHATVKRLAESDPGNAKWQRDLSYSLYRLGRLHTQQEQWSDALPLLEQCLAIAERLAALAPTNVMFQEDVAASRSSVARVREKLGR